MVQIANFQPMKTKSPVKMQTVRNNDVVMQPWEKNQEDGREAALKVETVEDAIAEIQKHGDLHVYEHLNEELKSNRQVVMACFSGIDRNGDRCGGLSFEYMSEELRGDKEIARAAIQCFVPNLRYIAKNLQTDRELAMMALNLDGIAFVSH